ncbi:MAG TPA: hypothetical protein VFF62_08350 [Candidatus Nitrosocosmicus sp.]|jgi:hypothetical protein|nr:hypothetical protein [Candidatus Nitrosocosmicus sp.]
MDTVLEVLASTSFLEKVLLLLVGAALTGIIVPVVKFRMDQSRFEQQKKFEAELARQAEIGSARAQFLRDLVDPVWQFQLLALQVSYDSHSAERFQAALAAYDEQSWHHLKRIRAIVGGARWFTSESAYRALTDFVDGWLIHEVDMELMKRRRGGGKANWSEFNQWLYAESRRRTDALLVILAKDFGLGPAEGR